VTVPARSETGSAAAATRSPTVSAQAAWTAASFVFGAAPASAARNAVEAGRGVRRRGVMRRL